MVDQSWIAKASLDILPKPTNTQVEIPLENLMRKHEDDPIDMLQGTLDMLILRTLLFGPRHGHAITKSIEQTSQNVLRVDHGSLYPALQRLERRGLVSARWGTSENNRRARFYRLTSAGRKRLISETGKWERLTEAIARILNPNREEI
jgi:PadR family transcriptional regulator